MPIKILVADDHEVVRAGIMAMLQGSDIRIIAEAADGTAPFKLAKKYKPDLVLLDVRMSGSDGLTCLTRGKLDLSNIPVVMFSAFDNPTYIARALALGASGYVLKSATRTRLVNAIRAAASGDSIWSKEDLRGVTGGLAASTDLSNG